MKRYALAILVVTLIFATTALLFACDNAETIEKAPELTMVFLGDSICEGVLGASPIAERENYCYYGVLGQRNNYRFINRSVSGLQTKPFLDYINRADNGATITNTYIREADVLHVSILGNDLLQNRVDQALLEVAKEDYTRVDEILKGTKANFAKIVETLRQLNPDAVLMIQNVYNPLFSQSVKVTEEIKDEIASLGYSPEDYHELGARLLNRLNAIASDYLEQNPESFILLDVQKEFDKFFEEDEQLGVQLLYNDHVHPSNFGHAVIADLTQRTLEQIELANKDEAIAKYKQMKIAQYGRLFDGDKDGFAKKINAATDCDAITRVYFSETKTLSPVYKKENAVHYVPETAYYPSEDVQFFVSDLSMQMVDMDIAAFIDKELSTIVLQEDGTIDVNILLKPSIASSLGILLLNMEGTDLTAPVENYCKPLFPGFTLQDLEKSFGLIEDSVCVSILGIDYESANIQKLQQSLAANGTIPGGLVAPKGLGFRINAQYYLKDVNSQYSGDYVGVFVGNHHKNSDPFVIMTVEKDEEGSYESITFRIELLGLCVTATR